LKKERKNFFHKSKQEKQGVPQNSCDLINDYGFKCTTMSIQNWPFFLLFTQKETTNDNARRE